MKTSKDVIQVGDRTIYSTTDYSQFNIMHGNRNIDRRHVKELQRLMLDNGNLTNSFPVVVNEEMEVIDGQHRLTALQELGWEVAYIVEKGATINVVRAINLGNKNWNWRDVAESFVQLGNKEYEWFLRFVDRHELGYSLAMRFADHKNDKRVSSSDYYQGYLFTEHKTNAEQMAEHFKRAMKELPEGTSQREVGYALHALRKSPAYNEERMIQKLEEKGHTLPTKASVSDYMRKLEELFNDKLSEENKVRLF